MKRIKTFLFSLFSSIRSFWLTASIIKIADTHRSALIDIASRDDQNVLLLDKCSQNAVKRAKTSIGVRCAYSTTNTYDYKSAFTQSIFCLIAKTERLFQINLIEALAANCIPVIFADNVVLPFPEVGHKLDLLRFRK